jgi:purine-binding chemotaxis protein CheW
MRPARSRSDPQKTLVGFFVGDIHYAIDIGRVVQIVNPLALSELPHLPQSVAGVSDYRGAVVPVVDLRVRFGLPSQSATSRTKWIVVNVNGPAAALVVDGVSDVFGTAGAELRPAPGLGDGDDKRGLLGVTTHRDRLTFVLDLGRLRPLLDAVGAPVRPAMSPGPVARPSLRPKP